jgi:hypothetical protein
VPLPCLFSASMPCFHFGGSAAGLWRREGEELEGNGHTCLFVGDLPGSWTTPDLADFFSSEFGGAVVEARVIGEQVGKVTLRGAVLWACELPANGR